MQISAISAPNFRGKRDNLDALIGLDDTSIRQIAYMETASKFDNKKSKKITNALFYSAPIAAGLGAAVFTKGKSKIFSKNVSGVAARVANGLQVAAGWTAALLAVDAVRIGRNKLVEKSPEARKFDKEHPVISLLGTLAAGVGAVMLVGKGAEKLASKKAPKFLQNATENVANFLNNNKGMVGVKNNVKKVLDKTPSALKEFGASMLSWAPSLLIFGGMFHSFSSANAQNRDLMNNYTRLKNMQSGLAQARVRELSMENDFLKTDVQNAEDLELLKNPTVDLAETITELEENA